MDSRHVQSGLEQEIARIFSRSVTDLPVYKDLPRLAGRITVEGHFSKPPIKITSSLSSPAKVEVPHVKVEDTQSSSLNPDTVRKFLNEVAPSLGYNQDSIEAIVKRLEDDWYFYVDGSLLLIEDDKWRDYGIVESLVQLLKEKAATVKTVEKQLENQLLSVKKPASLRLSIDVASKPRDVETQDKLEVIPEPELKPHEMNKQLMVSVFKVVKEVATRCESQDTLFKLNDFINSQMKREKMGEPELESVDIIDVVGIDSKTARIFKAIHQNIIFAAVYQLKTKLPSTYMTRDVRTREGWRISVIFQNNVVIVAHRKREQSLATAPKDEQFWYEWEVRMMFDSELTTLHSAILRITDLGFDENIDPKKREDIKKKFFCGNLIVS